MDKRGGPKKAVEVIYRLALTKPFQQDVQEMRRRTGIPSGGLVESIK